MRTFITVKNEFGRTLQDTDITCIDSVPEYLEIIRIIEQKFKEQKYELWFTFTTNNNRVLIEEINMYPKQNFTIDQL